MKKQVVIAGVAALVGLAAIGAVSLITRGSSHSRQDVEFVTNMVPHHEGALDMADTLLAKNDIPSDVRALAQRIKNAQKPEIDRMTQWLDTWGEPRLTSDHSGHTMNISGMMTGAELQAFDEASGVEAARLFLTGMITHHQGAIDMARAEIDAGQFDEAVELAQAIAATQTQEIAEMEQLLDNLQ